MENSLNYATLSFKRLKRYPLFSLVRRWVSKSSRKIGEPCQSVQGFGGNSFSRKRKTAEIFKNLGGFLFQLRPFSRLVLSVRRLRFMLITSPRLTWFSLLPRRAWRMFRRRSVIIYIIKPAAHQRLLHDFF